MSKYLVEIGTEELPYKFIPSAMKQLSENISKSLEDNRITFSDIKTYGTPRRLTVFVEGISESQPDIIKKIKGPPATACYDADGNLTKAAEGFAKKQGISTDLFYKESVADIEYVFVDIHDKGRTTSEVLSEIIPAQILKLQGSHFMRWGDLEIKFSRPIRWIVSILDENEVKFAVGNVESSRTSRGHRFYGKKEVKITSIDKYFDILESANVIVDPAKRKEIIVAKATETAEKAGGKVHIDSGLLDEVTFITEWPVPVLGEFAEKYLEVPKDVTVTVMASHQRYFPVLKKDSDELLNCFITMSNQGEECVDNIKCGNERVIKARLDDAIFFYREDNKKTLVSRLEDLKGVTFQRGLGTMFDKTNRIVEISAYIAEKLSLSAEKIADVKRAASLTKADLVTNLVREFTELQGVIGSQYAKLNGEKPEVSGAVREHYMPLSSDGELAETLLGQITGIADKIDTICGVFSLGKAPTGSADPLGLRRAALGCITTLIRKADFNIDISDLVRFAIEIQPIEIENKVALSSDICEFITQRLRIYLNDSYKYDVVDAVLACKNPLADLKDVVGRTEVLSRLVQSADYNEFHDAANRILRIAKSDDISLDVNNSLFVEDAETQLWNCAKCFVGTTLSYEELVKAFRNCVPAITSFFDNVLVMDEDEKIRNNRLSVLANIKKSFMQLADFSKIVA